jgi:hypothetical protein
MHGNAGRTVYTFQNTWEFTYSKSNLIDKRKSCKLQQEFGERYLNENQG